MQTAISCQTCSAMKVFAIAKRCILAAPQPRRMQMQMHETCPVHKTRQTNFAVPLKKQKPSHLQTRLASLRHANVGT
ncbi:hypothetical protein BaRGS_00036689 [Batillaria attramentaria]|uniref:Uncharacterized protein n=1 Tax=Batillaria attramentaria TaxID=370345 RepID=A0ABD0JB76_9CAEN